MAVDMKQEEAELAGLQQIDQLCDSKDPNALPQIKQIVAQLIQAQQAEMQGTGGGKEEEGEEGGEGGPSTHDKMVEAVKNQMGE